jgi:hypothetical protein
VVYARPVIADDEVTQPATPLGVDEDFYSPPVPAPVVYARPVLDAVEIAPQPAPLQVDEDFYQPPRPAPVVYARPVIADDEVTQPAPLQVDEEGWRPGVAVLGWWNRITAFLGVDEWFGGVLAPQPTRAAITVADATVTAAALAVADATAIATALAVVDATTNAATVTADDPGPYSPQIVFLTVTYATAPTTARLRMLSPSGVLSTLSLTPMTATTFSAQADLEGVGPWWLCADDAGSLLCTPGLLTLTASSDGF